MLSNIMTDGVQTFNTTKDVKMKLIDSIKKDEELANQILELDESEHLDVEIQRLLNLETLATQVDSYAFVLQAVDSKIEFLKDQKKQLDQFIKSLENKQSRFKDVLAMHFQLNDVEQAIGNQKKISLQSRESNQFDESAIDKKFFKKVTETVLDKEKLIAALASLKDGESISGVTKKTSWFIKTYNNSTNKNGVLIKKVQEIKKEESNENK